MEKIYNNLSKENLTKTEWFNQFTIFQQNEILAGIDECLNVSVYAEKKYKATQMEQIRLGLKANIDVSIYTKKKISLATNERNQIRIRR